MFHSFITDVFATGIHDGKMFDETFLDSVVENFRKLQYVDPSKPYYEPNLIQLPDTNIGHEPDMAKLREVLKRTDHLSGGRITNLWRKGDKLFARFDDVPDAIMQKIKNGELSYKSVEINKTADGRGNNYYPVLRRVAFLGGDPPKVKNLQRLQDAQIVAQYDKPLTMSFADGSAGAEYLLCFSELNAMNRQQMLDKLAQLKFDVTAIGADWTDAQIKTILDSWVQMVGQTQGAANGSLGTQMNAGDTGSNPPQHPTGNNNQNPQPPPQQYTDPENKTTEQLEAELKASDPKTRALFVLMKRQFGAVAPALQSIQQSAQNQRAAEYEQFCDEQIRLGKLTTAEKFGFVRTWLAMDDTPSLQFADASQPTKALSPIQAQMELIRQRIPNQALTLQEKIAYQFNDGTQIETQTAQGNGVDLGYIQKILGATATGRPVAKVFEKLTAPKTA